MEGSEAIAEAMVAAGCRFFSGYPMTPFTEVLEHMARLLPEAGGTCINAESELEAVGMAWGAAATGTRAATGSVGQGLSLMQESLSEICHARLPLVVLNMARGQGDYFQATRGGGHGDYRHIVLAPADVTEAVELVQLAFHLADRWRNPVMFLGDYFLAHVLEAVEVEPARFPPPEEKPWSLDGMSGGSGSAKLISPLGQQQARGARVRGPRHPPGHDRGARPGDGPRGRATRRDGVAGGLRARGRRLRDARQLRPLRRRAAARRRAARGVRAAHHAVALSPLGHRRGRRGARAVAVYELNTGQMVEDVRLSVLGRCPVEFIGGMSFDSSGFGIAPDLDVDRLGERIARVLDATALGTTALDATALDATRERV